MTEPLITKGSGPFSMECRVSIPVQAPAPRLWALLTDARGFPSWNSTVTRIEGDIREGGKLRVHVPGSDRTMTPTVTRVVPNQRMTWAGGFGPVLRGVRTFELREIGGGATEFIMSERFSGLMLPLVKRMFPDFGPIFTRYATDLKRQAER